MLCATKVVNILFTFFEIINIADDRLDCRMVEKTETVKRLLANNFSARDVASYAAVTVAFVEKVKKTMQ